MRAYQQIIVLDYVIENGRGIVELGIPNPNYDPKNNNSEPIRSQFVTPIEIFRDVRTLELRLGADSPVVKAGKQVIARIDKVRREKYFHETA